MKWDEVRVDFPTLLVAFDWVERHCVVPDGFDRGKPFELVPWQGWALLNFYRVRRTAKPGQLASAFHYRRGQIVGPQKYGKAPYTSAHICVEAVGPALFAGFAEGGEVWDCREHGCGCGWIYEYSPGEAMAQRWPTPLIQITAYSEKQAHNIFGMLRPMIQEGPLDALIPRTGEEFIRLPRRGRIDVVTAEARSRLGQPVTFVAQDETGIWTSVNGMITVAETQRRGLAGMRGRAEETSNAWDPNEGSVAQRTAESQRPDIFRLHPQAAEGLSYTNKQERRRIHRHVYDGCHWISLDAIEAEAAELIETDAPQAERFFGNRMVAGEGKAFNGTRWDELARPDYRPPKGALIAVGADGAQFQDAIAVIGTEIETGFMWPIIIIERPLDAGEDYEHNFDDVDEALTEAADFYEVWRIYIDPGSASGNIEPLVERWLKRWGRERVLKWYMHRLRPTGVAVHNFATAISAGTVSHPADETFTRHIKNAVRQKLNIRDEDNPNRQLYKLSKERFDSKRKIDGAAAAVLSWECRGDAVEADAGHAPSREVKYSDQRAEHWDQPVYRLGEQLFGEEAERYRDRQPGEGPAWEPVRGR